MRVKPSHSIKPLQSTRSGSTRSIRPSHSIEVEPMQTRSRIVAREFKSGGRLDLYARPSLLEAVGADAGKIDLEVGLSSARRICSNMRCTELQE